MISLINSLSFSKLNKLGALLVFFVSLLTYSLTLEPTTSFWDCGEYIATAYKIQVGHPPGAPLFVIIANFFSNLTFGNSENVAWMINFMSALCSALTIVFLYWIIIILCKKIINKKPTTELTFYSKFSILFSGIIGSLIYTFSDSFWFSAVEGEVYAMSSLFTAVVFWSILKWEEEFKQINSSRWLVFIAFLIGLSVGVHMLNLLAIPAITSIYLYKTWRFKSKETSFFTKFKHFSIVNLSGILILGIIFYILVPQTVNFFGKIELYFVNELGFGFNSGTIAFLVSLIIFISSGLLYSRKKNFSKLNTTILSLLFFLIGYSSFFVLIIRSNANTPIDENNPEDAVSLLAYLNREQYGSHPLIYGYSFNSSDSTLIDGKPVYVKGYELKNIGDRINWKNNEGKNIYKQDFSTKEKANLKKNELINLNPNKTLQFEINDKYIISDARKDWKTIYKKNDESFFPRMWSSSPLHINGRMNDGYLGWSGMKKTNQIPTFLENIKFFWNYQIKHMYIRYFMWNFSGKQNDIQGHGSKLEGNWITGINIIDNHILKLGPQDNLPNHLSKNAGNNKYYLLPFILGLFGMIYHFSKQKKDFWAIFLLFFFTGIAIVIQLNQTPYQPRERDYAYVGSFFAFAIWTGIGSLGTLQLLKHSILDKINNKKLNNRVLMIFSFFLFGIPTLMAYQNWDDHDRSNRYTARDFAKNYLASCKPNAILFTMGDNDTFPLWYVQEVEGYRTDVRVVNLSLLNTDWYIDQMKKDAYDGEAIPISIEKDLYKQGTRDVAYYYPYSSLIQENITINSLENQIKNINNTDPQQSIEIRNYLNNLNLMISKKNRLDALLSIGKMQGYNTENSTDNLFLDSINNTDISFKLSDFNKWIRSDHKYTKINVTKNKAHVYFPMSKLKFDVNKENAIKQNIVLEKDTSLIENELLIDFEKNQVRGLDKKSLMILDLLEKNDWERPIYFAITIGDPNQNPEPFLFLNDYLQLDGMVYQLVPIKNTNNESGRINSHILYDNLMNKFNWGGIDLDQHVYIDETNARMIRNFKNIFNRLTSKLIDEGDLEKADSVIQKSLSTLRKELIPLEIYDLPLLENYFDLIIEKNINQIQLGEEDSLLNDYINLNELTNLLISRYNSELEYYNTFKNIDIQKNWEIQNQIKLASQSLNALFSLSKEIPNIEKNSKEQDNTVKIINKNFEKTINLIEESYNKRKVNEAQNLFSIVAIYTELANLNNDPDINLKINELERISILINTKKQNDTSTSSSKNQVCICIEEFLNNQLTENCNMFLNDFFSNIKTEQDLAEVSSSCPQTFEIFIQQQMEAMEKSEDL